LAKITAVDPELGADFLRALYLVFKISKHFKPPPPGARAFVEDDEEPYQERFPGPNVEPRAIAELTVFLSNHWSAFPWRGFLCACLSEFLTVTHNALWLVTEGKPAHQVAAELTMWDDEELSSEHSSFMVLIRRLRDQHSEEEQARDVRKMRAASLALKIAGQLIRSLTMAVHDLNGEKGITTGDHHDASKVTIKAITKFERSLVVSFI
jgi:hypothetical protein